MHPFADLSAYLDGALEREQRAAVAAHLGTCPLCAARVTELRATARLIAGLPVPVPSRSLVPRVSVPFWLAPMRTLATVASGAATLLFVASTLLVNAPMATTGAGSPASAPEAGRNAVPGAVPAPASTATADVRLAEGTPTPSPGAAFSVVQTGAPTASVDGRTPQKSGSDATTQDSTGARGETDSTRPLDFNPTERRQLGPTPWVWLALAVALGGLALMLQRRLRAA